MKEARCPRGAALPCSSMLGFVVDGIIGSCRLGRSAKRVWGCDGVCNVGAGLRGPSCKRRQFLVIARFTREQEDVDVDRGYVNERALGERSENGTGREKGGRKGIKAMEEDGCLQDVHGITDDKVRIRGDGYGEVGGREEEEEEKQKEMVTLFRLGGRDWTVPGKWLLYTVPFFWGSFGPAVRLLFTQDGAPHPAIFNSERLLLSMLVYSPVLIAELQSFSKDRKTQRQRGPDGVRQTERHDMSKYSFFGAGLELGVWVFLANVSQVIGLQQTSASRAAFFNQLQTVFVPVAAALLGIGAVGQSTVAASAVAVLGVALLSLDKSHGVTSSLAGDGLEVLSAVFFSAYIIRLSEHANKVRTSPLVATKIAVQTILSIIWVAGMEVMTSTAAQPVTNPDAPVLHLSSLGVLINVAVVAWTGLMSSAVSGWAQTKGQEFVPASEAAVIFATQPLWASGLAAVVLGEGFGPQGIVGGLLIIVSTIIASRGSGSKGH